MTEMKFSLYFVFQMSDSILPGEMVPTFYCKGLVGDHVKMGSMTDYKGTFLVLVFYIKDLADVGEATLNLMGDLAADKEFKLEFLVISTDSCQTHKAWIDRREEGAPVAMLGDMIGKMARMLGRWTPPTTLHAVMCFL